MKKIYRLFFGLLPLLCMALLTVSCSKVPEAALVPDNAAMVININVASLWEKGELDQADNIGFLKMLRQEVRNENAELGAIVDGLFEDPSSSGLDFRHDLMLFATDGSHMAFAAVVKNQKQLGEKLKTLFAQTGVDAQWKEGDYNRVEIANGAFVIVWDKQKAYITIKDMADGLMSLKKSESLKGNKQFADYWDKRADIGLWMGFDRLFNLAKQEFGGVGDLSAIEEYKGSSSAGGINFEKGQIIFNLYNFGPTVKLMKMTTDHKFNADLLGYLPEEALAAISLAVDVDSYIEYMEKINKEVAEALDEEVIDGVTVRSLVQALDGSIAISLSGLDVDGKKVKPNVNVVADLRDAELVRKSLAQAQLPMSDGYYVIENDFMPIYIAVNDKAIAITTMLPTAQRVAKADKSSKGCKAIAKEMKKRGSYFYADLQIDHYPAGVRELLPPDAVTLMRQYLKTLEAYNDAPDKGHMTLFLNNEKQNSLLFTLHFVDDNLMTFARLFQSSSDEYYEEELYVDDEDYEGEE